MDDNAVKDISRRLLILESMMMDIYDSVVTQKKRCPLCNSEIRLYLPFGVHDKLRRNAQCPICRSLERHRALWLCLQSNTDIFEKTRKATIKLLHFAPEKCFYDRFSHLHNVDYYPVDVNSNYGGVELRDIVDIQNIQYSDNMFDIIILIDVLEHIPDERAALMELRRVLNSRGAMYVSVPIFTHLERTLEKPEYNTDELRKQHYGQSDHLRAYGRDFTERLESVGFEVKVYQPCKQLSDEQLVSCGLTKNEKVFECSVRKE